MSESLRSTRGGPTPAGYPGPIGRRQGSFGREAGVKSHSRLRRPPRHQAAAPQPGLRRAQTVSAARRGSEQHVPAQQGFVRGEARPIFPMECRPGQSGFLFRRPDQRPSLLPFERTQGASHERPVQIERQATSPTRKLRRVSWVRAPSRRARRPKCRPISWP